jgi:hypothetical protein
VEKLGEMKSGSFIEDRYNDALSASNGKPEHPGRLRGHFQGYVTIKDVYGKGKRWSDTNHDSCNKRFKNVSNSYQIILAINLTTPSLSLQLEATLLQQQKLIEQLTAALQHNGTKDTNVASPST